MPTGIPQSAEKSMSPGHLVHPEPTEQSTQQLEEAQIGVPNRELHARTS
jgi:hypothetical protein